ncbi:MAG: quinone oxidoreductase [Gemmatimonadaceae bacterium]|nr:quinone oxidoreductase [Gemmatimonadaceae bacterium]NUO93497.1 quinone oxidoreductase [Gemmatimonadaceae bacterium]NUR35788.1 quinone oxidoreductase [Gemmatimonadaceae bacterium]NUS32258.1 quinone oxidoreductase [Gemmatimonadaceae bacterium]NUS47149.1 quinone oxidoreductase [Gemmatimonadaceae bacterium]
MHAIRVHEHGGPEVLTLETVDDPSPGPGEAVVRMESIGVNFIDCYFRKGQYKTALPFTPGSEGAGTVAAVGDGVVDVAVGDRVASQNFVGAYAELARARADRLVPLPDGLSARDGAAAMLQGMTAHYLAASTHTLQAGDCCLVHAAAGGVGLLLCQIARRHGAFVIGTVSTDEKAALAREAGANETILYTRQDFVAEVKRITGGAGVQVVYDSVGATTFLKGLDCLAPRGLMALFGQSSGPVSPLDPQLLNQKGSLFLTRPTLAHYVATPADLRWRAGEVLGWVRDGSLRLRIDRDLPLANAADAHRALEARETTGKVLLHA